MSGQTVGLLTSVAAQFRAATEVLAEGQVRLRVPLEHIDGFVEHYTLVAKASGAQVAVREEIPTNLPSCCPERHINGDGTFCLAWQEVDNLWVTDDATAVVWWETLLKFLLEQRRAARKRRWPTPHGRAHGSAARFQLQAQQAAQALRLVPAGQLVEAAGLRIERIRAHNTGRGETLRLFRGSHYLYSVWVRTGALTNGRRRCCCGGSGLRRPRRYRACGDHATHASTLALALLNWQREEQNFWQALQGSQCCGTCDGCPLSSQNAD